MGEKQLFAGGKPALPGAMISNFLSNGSTIEAVGNYAGDVEQFKFTCKDGNQKLHLARMIITLEDNGEFNTDLYGKDIVLTNGVGVFVRNSDDELLIDMTADDKVHTNIEWSQYCFDVEYHDFGTGNANKWLAVRWTFEKSGKFLSLSAGDYISAELNDDFTGLIAHRFLIQGFYA